MHEYWNHLSVFELTVRKLILAMGRVPKKSWKFSNLFSFFFKPFPKPTFLWNFSQGRQWLRLVKITQHMHLKKCNTISRKIAITGAVAGLENSNIEKFYKRTVLWRKSSLCIWIDLIDQTPLWKKGIVV